MARAPITSPYSAAGEPSFSATMTGRIVVGVGQNTVELHLFHWSLKPTATLTLGETDDLIEKLKKARARAGPAKRVLDDDDFSDVA